MLQERELQQETDLSLVALAVGHWLYLMQFAGANGDTPHFYNERAKAGSFPGLRERQLLRSTEDPDEGKSVIMWDTQEDLLNYERSEVRQLLAKEAEHLYRGDVWVKHFEVRDRSASQ